MRFSVSPRGFTRTGLLALFLAVVGCGDSSGVGRTFPVKGAVTLDGNPISAGVVQFLPEGGSGSGHSPMAMIKDGTYELTTNGKPGAPPGDYKVTVSTNTPAAMTGGGPKVPKLYESAASTRLQVKVSADAGKDAYDLKLTSR
jgi:hypothetical protein